MQKHFFFWNFFPILFFFRYAVAFMWDTGASVGDLSGHQKTIMSCDIKQTRPYRVATGGEDLTVNWFEGPPFKFHHSMKVWFKLISNFFFLDLKQMTWFRITHVLWIVFDFLLMETFWLLSALIKLDFCMMARPEKNSRNWALPMDILLESILLLGARILNKF